MSAPVRVGLRVADAGVRAELRGRLAGIGAMDDPLGTTLVLAAGRTVVDALEAGRGADPGSLLIVADALSVPCAGRALRAGVRVVLRLADAEGPRLSAALISTRDGDGWLPHELMLGLVAGGGPDPEPAPAGPGAPLSPRQRTVLALIAEGHGNAGIASELGCSQHTVKNVVYDLMTRLQATNRAHAVAKAVRTGLV